MDPTIQFDIQVVPGFKNFLFGGEGLFLATVTGPGRVALQSMPVMNLAEEIGRYLPNKSGESSSTAGSVATAAGGAVVGGILGSLFGGNNNNS
jgi:hypothetical protein